VSTPAPAPAPAAVTQLSAPFQAPLVDQRAYLTQPWLIWFNDLWKRVGGLSALSNGDLSELIDGQVQTLADLNTALDALNTALGQTQANAATALSQVATLQATVSGIQTTITTIQGQITTIQGNITTLQSQMTTVQSDLALTVGLVDAGIWSNL